MPVTFFEYYLSFGKEIKVTRKKDLTIAKIKDQGTKKIKG